MGRKRIAIVVQRYGPEVLGGSESLARSLAHLLADVYDIDVLTTCAKDYITWKNDFPAGESMDGPVRVIRFIVDSPRSRLFNLYNAFLLKVPHTRGMEELWMRMQGPVTPELIKYIEARKDHYDLFIFMTYLYGTTYYGIQKVFAKSIMIPTAHDDLSLRLGLYREVFEKTRVICLTDKEKEVVENTFRLAPGKCEVIGAPVEAVGIESGDSLEKFGVTGDYILYIGRVDRLKGVDTLCNYFMRYVAERRSSLKLVICGKGPLPVPASQNIIYAGYVEDAAKYPLIRSALATVLPSQYESYSLSVIESLACAIPVVVNGKCSVLKDHCEKSSGGFSYLSYNDFARALDTLRQDPKLRATMGEAGKSYVSANYSPAAVIKRYLIVIESIVGKPITSGMK